MWSDPSSWRAVVTGGASGLGASVCAALDGAGATVVTIDRKSSNDVDTVIADLSDTEAAEQATVEAISRIGSVDAVICCAGTDTPGPLHVIDRCTWDQIVTVNLLSMAAVVRTAMPHLIEQSGRVITVASTLGHRVAGDATAYCASKFGVVGFTRALAAECKGQVGVTLLTPGGMHTAFFDDRDEQYKPPPDAVLADPAEVASAVVWALSRPPGVEVRELVITSPVEQSWP